MVSKNLNHHQLTLYSKNFFIVIAFAVSFAYVEAAIVAYLRTIFYPEGFSFPLGPLGDSAWQIRLLATEIGREIASMVLVLTVALLAGRNRRQRFAAFLIIFAVWDIFYYVWLKVLISWPGSIMAWDILFLIPAAWAGPVLAVVLISCMLFIMGWFILWFERKGKPLRPTMLQWAIYCFSGVVVVTAFCMAGRWKNAVNYKNAFSWLTFFLGYALAATAFLKSAADSFKRN